MVTLFILLLLILGGVFLYLKQQKKADTESDTESDTETESDATETKAKAKKKVALAEAGADKARAAETKAKKDADKAAALLAKNKGDASLKAALQKAKARKAAATKRLAAAKARKAAAAKRLAAAEAKKARDAEKRRMFREDQRRKEAAAKAAADAKAKKEAAARAAAFEKKKKAHAARLKREADEAKRREEEEKRQIQEAKRKQEQKKRDRQRALDNWGTGMGGGTSGFPVKGHYAVVGAKTGYLGQINAKLTNTKVGKMTMKKCHDLGRDLQKKKWPVSAVGYRTSAHPDPKWKNTCFFYGGWDHDGEKTIVPTGARLTGNSDKNHAIACMNPGEVLNKACKSYSYISKKMRAIRARRSAERRRLNEKPGGVQWRWGFPRHGWVNDKLNQGFRKIKNQSAKQCHQHAVNVNKSAPGFVRLWGHYGSNYPDKNKRNTCFFYTANKTFVRHNDPKPPHFHGRASWNGDRRHSSGCVEGGKRVSEGCKDRSKINRERADHRKAVVLPGNISRQTGYRAGHTNFNMKPHQLKARGPNECRLRAIQLNKSGAGVKGWGFRKSNHPNPPWRNTCFFYAGKGPHGYRKGHTNHLTGCVKPGDNVNWGCTRTRPVDCQQKWSPSRHGWSPCTKLCGGGTQKREYKTIRKAQGIGRACKTVAGAYAPKIRACNTHICQPTARFIKIERRNGPGTIINLNRVMVISNGRDVARGRPAVLSSTHSNFHARHLTDGNHRTMAHSWWGHSIKSGHRKNSPKHGSVGGFWDNDHQWVYIDLGREYPIDYVWILNRQDCCKDRLKNMRFFLGWGRNAPGGTFMPRYFKVSDRLGNVAWDQILWQPKIGGVLSPQKVPGSYWAKYDDSDD